MPTANMGFCASGADGKRIGCGGTIRLWSWRDDKHWALVLNLNFSNSIGLTYRAGRMLIPRLTQSPIVRRNVAFKEFITKRGCGKL